MPNNLPLFLQQGNCIKLQLFLLALSVLLCYNGSLLFALASPLHPSQNQYASDAGCISKQHLTSLATGAKSRLKSSIPTSVKCVCTPFTSPLEGWDITCFDDSFSSSAKKQKNDLSQLPIRVNGSKGPLSSIGSTEFDLNYNHNDHPSPSASTTGPGSVYNLATSTLAFVVRNQGKVVDILCNSAIPDFKPAMFQGK